ncbi:hypothetical protein H0H87_008473 [Tephrocybe sp. NHM501043]|nr:hypothetical protein H0H87_008473 [Tephrocybe sp. NHM501043]
MNIRMASSTGSPAYSDGKIDFVFQGETYQTYYKVIGDIKTSSNRTPLVVLHGGPGLCHNYLAPFSDLATKHDIPVIFYDQLGNGLSTHLRDKDPAFWTIDLFINELENLLKHFGIQDAFDIAGHSWGGILASEFEARRQPVGLKRLILSDSLAAYSLWIQSNIQLLQAFPASVQEGIMAGMKEPAKFYSALLKFHAVHGCVTKPPLPNISTPWTKYLAPTETPQLLLHRTSFQSPFKPTLTWTNRILNEWSIIDRLHLIRVPTFVINGRKDISQDFVVKPFFDKIQKVKWVTMEGSSHMPFFEERDRYIYLVEEFLR